MLVKALRLAKLKHQSRVVLIERAAQKHVDSRPTELAFKTLLNDVRRELKLTEANEVSGYHLEDLIVSGYVVELENVLNKVVSIWVLDQVVNMLDNHISQGKFLSLPALLKAPLHHTAAMLVGAYFYAIADASIKYELCEVFKSLSAFNVGLLRVL